MNKKKLFTFRKLLNLILVLLTAMISLHCSNTNLSSNTGAIEDFEGKVYYQVKWINFQLDDESQFASDLVLHYKKGFIRKEYWNQNNQLLSFTVYNPETNTTYSFTKGSDTVLFYHPEPSEALVHPEASEGKGNEEMLLGYHCKRIGIEANGFYHEYFITDSLKVNKKYINGDGCNFLFSDLIILKYRLTQQITKEVTATKIEPTSIEQSVFKLDTLNKILIPLE